ncbi:2-aminoethanethiol dioxygenase [Condylostylus longicornis]|uniref:2-aminoethanethiol dioxygenase n=1 Tax=Condylostylus longicornis TaxID=2530218 RepID=UPI00244DA329|nr:2-aminoethanethiol dioxygenase [Condylostylus longicornis]
MSTLFSKVVKQAVITFDRKNSSKLKTNFNVLKELVDQLSISDVGLDSDLVTEESFDKPLKAPCTFVDIFENSRIKMSVFILRGDYKMPLHDHPVMHGILKVLSGKVIVQSYSKIAKNSDIDPLYDINTFQIDVIKENPLIIDSDSKCAVLTPTEKNFHEITAIENVAAFFDILSPPYDANIPIYGPRPCSFYRKKSLENENDHRCTLEKIPCPRSYYCDESQYKKPSFLYDYMGNSSKSNTNH